MKSILILLIGLLLSSSAQAGWFSSKPDLIPLYEGKIQSLENQLSAQSQTINHWQMATGSLGIGCVLLLVIGTALGAQTRKHYDGSTRRMGATPTTTSLNGRTNHMGQTAQEENQTTLAA